MCSKPVCESCIIKASFGKHEKTFQNRRRHLCPECWATSNPLRENRIEPLHIGRPVSYTPYYQGALVFQGYCSCTARDGWLCLECKTAQRPDPEIKAIKCAGQSCSNLLDETTEELRACLWCHLPLHGKPSRGESRRDYDSRHLYARSNSDTWSEPDNDFFASYPRKNRSLIPYSEQRYCALLAESAGLIFGSPPKLKVRRPRPLQNLMLIDYSSLGVAPPPAERMVDSVFGTFRYDPGFLLAFRLLCRKQPTPDWESTVVNAILKQDIAVDTEGDDDDEVPDLDDGEGSDEATLHPYDDDDGDSDEVTLAIATPRISLDYPLMSQRSRI